MMDQRSFENLTDAELANLRDAINVEVSRRENQRREKLIEDFREVWYRLREEKIEVKYYEDSWDDDGTRLSEWDNFEFC